MKKSNITVICLTVVLFMAAIACDFILAASYRNIDLDDPYKNFHEVPVNAFRVLRISGGNGYAIEIRKGSKFNIKLMNSRSSFFKMLSSGDTTSIEFNVASQTYQKPTDCVTGLIISVPALDLICVSGTNIRIGPLFLDSLSIESRDGALTQFQGLQVNALELHGDGSFDFTSNNRFKQLKLDLWGSSGVLMHDVRFETFIPSLRDSSSVTFFNQPLKELYSSLRK